MVEPGAKRIGPLLSGGPRDTRRAIGLTGLTDCKVHGIVAAGKPSWLGEARI